MARDKRNFTRWPRAMALWVAWETAQVSSEMPTACGANPIRPSARTAKEEPRLIRVERAQLWIGAAVCALALLVLAWAYVQRYHVISVPGVLR